MCRMAFSGMRFSALGLLLGGFKSLQRETCEINHSCIYPPRPARNSQLRYYEVFSAKYADSRVDSNHR
jgi:hypothetical protein